MKKSKRQMKREDDLYYNKIDYNKDMYNNTILMLIENFYSDTDKILTLRKLSDATNEYYDLKMNHDHDAVHDIIELLKEKEFINGNTKKEFTIKYDGILYLEELYRNGISLNQYMVTTYLTVVTILFPIVMLLVPDKNRFPIVILFEVFAGIVIYDSLKIFKYRKPKKWKKIK